MSTRRLWAAFVRANAGLPRGIGASVLPAALWRLPAIGPSTALLVGLAAIVLSGCGGLPAAFATTPEPAGGGRGTFTAVLASGTSEPRPSPPARATVPARPLAELTRPAPIGTVASGSVSRDSATPSRIATDVSPAARRPVGPNAIAAPTGAPTPVPTPTLGLAPAALPTLRAIATIGRPYPGSPTPAPRASPVGAASAPLDRLSCPSSHPIKAIVGVTDRLYYLPIQTEYQALAPTQCFASEARAAERGFVRGRR